MAKLRLIQCGMGGMGPAWWNGPVSASPDFDLVAIVDVLDAPLQEAAAALHIPPDRCFKSLDDAIDRVPADAVLTVTPPIVHVEHARAAFSAGLHLLTEKPLAHDLPSARLMIDLAAKAGRQLLVAQNYRYRPFIHRLKQLLDDQTLGPLGHAHLDFYMPADFPGTFREQMKFPLLIDMAIHHVDLIRHVTARDITHVTAHSFRPAWSWFDHQPALKMLLELQGNIPIGYSGDWTALGKATSWWATWRLQCEQGSIHLENDQLTIARCEKWNKNPTLEPIASPPIPLESQPALLAAFAKSIRTNRPAPTSGQNNLNSFATVIAAQLSAEQQRRIDINAMLDQM